MMAGMDSPVDQDVLIVGAGLSGIGMAAHLQMHSPDRSFALVERRANLGGTWDLFRYPGIRSDSDMHTLGFVFEPWRHEKSIADGPSILEYLNRIVDERGIREHIRFNNKVVGADWDSAAARWTVTMEDDKGAVSTTTARWLYLGSGYYDYDEPFDANFTGREDFAGQIIHPQFWPKDFDYSGKKVVVIGSGATAVTIVPSMADKAAHVTMLQRTPTWYAIRPAKDGFANFLRKILPEKTAYRLTRFKNIRLQDIVFRRAREKPEKVADFLTKKLKQALGDRYDPVAFTPPYNPWDQRLCLVPDADFFEAMKAGKASVVTDHIERFDKTGIQLKSGQHLDADVIITATGLKLAVAGKIPVRVDGEPVAWNEHFYYKACMFSNVPNFSVVFGYLNASWTLRADIVSEYVCRVLNHMRDSGTTVATPLLADPTSLTEENIFDFSSGYIQRALHIMPKNADKLPWRLSQNYVQDRIDMRTGPVDDGVLKFGKAASVSKEASAPALEAAE
ncbi:Predicted flavoprotein CzcO associated with the cation diffusion facilitator CzcD [Sphingopyxis terrae subsp. ummariensis]|uniref:Predicted flavoprotein CzcO associated with the cation diffusion facilitator CzcD n=2 Tax=Sphingopyxis terrae TaxID=33052 RepID=A0A1Y6EF47_9SPHN|nr:Predicted flavoprotein CzcO associated with the cation diffusion facilitator CzcD [Sphingopyxis terrae subsp. ummariensis]